MMSNLGRQTLQIVEWDVQQCTLNYGGIPCTAVLGTTGVRKCYNTFATCQDPANFSAGTLTLRFAKDQAGIPKGQNIFPALVDVSTNAQRISLGSPDERLGTLGKRARVTIRLRDFTSSDAYTDKYQAGRVDGTAQTDEGGYNPAERGTFFGKLMARLVYTQGQTIRVRNGYVGDAIGSMPSRTYVITEVAGPGTGGSWQITAQDLNSLTEDSKAVYPAPSEGAIAADIEDTGLPSFDLTPAGIGSTYAASGRASIGSEIVTFTRSSDTITITARGMDGSEAASHSEGDTFQECARFDAVPLNDVAETLFLAAGIPAGNLDTTGWQTEYDRWLKPLELTRTIAKPTGVQTLLSQLCDFGLIFFEDELNATISMKANRPVDLGETVADVSDDLNVIQGSMSRTLLNEQVITQAWVWHGVKDYTGDLSDPSNYARLYAAINSELESDDALGQTRIREFFQPWLGDTGNTPRARAIADRFGNRYGRQQQEVNFRVDVKDRDETELAGYISLSTRDVQSTTGLPDVTQMVVTSRDDIDPGHVIEVTAQTFQFTGRFGFWCENARGTYGASTAAQRINGFYWLATGTDTFAADGSRYFQWF